jgi:hypothetical protein
MNRVLRRISGPKRDEVFEFEWISLTSLYIGCGSLTLGFWDYSCNGTWDMKDEGTGEWRELHNEELHILYTFPNIRQIKSNQRE